MVDYDIERIWRGMKARCYYSNAKPYENCDVCYEWLINYESFVEWFLDNLYDCGEQKLELDKDLFSKGEKIYSPETCVFVPNNINQLFVKSNNREFISIIIFRVTSLIPILYSSSIFLYLQICFIRIFF